MSNSDEPRLTEFRFNALTDAWLPLIQESGATLWASPVEVLCEEKDGADLDYPRDDFRFYARLLLSALVQALFPAKTKGELKQRLNTPMNRTVVEARLRPVLRDFDLFGPKPFLQIAPQRADQAKEGGAAPFVFGEADLYQPRVRVEAISIPVAVVTLFIEHTYAGGAGRGYGAGPAGQPGAMTLVDPGSVRRAAWANTLTLDAVKLKYADDEDRPWSNAKRPARPRASIGLLGGLFFQPRAVWLIPAGEGRCSFTGQTSTLVRISPLLPKSELTKKPSKGEDVWQHPCAPLAVNSQGIGAIRLNAERPAWTGLAQLLDPLSKSKTRSKHPLEGPAPVLIQWKTLGFRGKRPRLLVLDFERDKANVKRRFFEAFPLTDDLLRKPDAVDRLRMLVSDAQEVEHALMRALVHAHDSRRLGGLALADARTSFWTASERPFLAWLAAVVAIDDGNGNWELANNKQGQMLNALRTTALSIFDAHAALSEFDPRKQERIARARRRLRRALWSSRTESVANSGHLEVTA